MFGIDVRWAGALAAALLVVIIGAPVFRRAPQDKRAVPPATSLPGPIPAYVLDAEEERPKQKQNEANRAPRKEAAPKAEAAPPKSAADDATASGRDLDQFAEPREGARESLERRDEIAATNADKKDAAATLEADAAQEPAAPTLQAAAPPAETKDLAKSTTARRQSAAAPVGGEAGTGASADEPPLVVRVTIHAIDGEGEAPEVARTPSDDRLAALRGRKYVLIVEAGGRVVAVEERPAGRKPAGDKAREADERRAARLRPLAESILREIAFQPGDRSRRLVVSIE
jgi:hypothetical protein